MKNLQTMKVGERFDYSSVDVDYLRTLETLPHWLKTNKRSRAEVSAWKISHHSECPPGHPKQFIVTPENWTGKVQGVVVLPDPDNIAWGSVTYKKEDKYQPDAGWRENSEEIAKNRYYVVYSSDYKKLWKPLPWNTVRMQLWEMWTYMHHQHEYKGYNDKIFFHPMSSFFSKVYKPEIDEHWTEDWKLKVLKDYHDAKQAEENEHNQYASKYALPERHIAVEIIRRYFPDYQPREDLIENPRSSAIYGTSMDYDWYYHYATLEDRQNDPVVAK